MVSPVTVSGSAEAPGKALWRPSVNRVLWGEPAFPGHVVISTCGGMVLVPARARKHACSLVPAYTDLLACSCGGGVGGFVLPWFLGCLLLARVQRRLLVELSAHLEWMIVLLV